MNITFYRLFNPDLKNFSNKFLVNHWNNIGKNENRIYSYESFFMKYPNFDYNVYKIYNDDINSTEKLDLMVHWHLEGVHQNRICFIDENIEKKYIDLNQLKIVKENSYTKTNLNESFDNNDKFYDPNNDLCNDLLNNNTTNPDNNTNKNIINNFLEKINENDINLINNSIKLIKNYIYPKENKNIIIELNNNLNDIFFKFFIGLSIAIHNKYNVYFIQNNIDNIDNIYKNNEKDFFKKISLFKNFHNKIITRNTLYNFTTYDTLITDYKFNFNSIFGNKESIILSNFKYSTNIFENYFNEIKNLLYFEKKIKLLKFLKILNNRQNIGIYVPNKDIDQLYYIKCLSLIDYHNMNIIIFTDNIDNLKNIDLFKNINYIYSRDLLEIKEDSNIEETDLILLSLCNYIIANNSSFSLWAAFLSDAKFIYMNSNNFWSNADFSEKKLSEINNYNTIISYSKNLNIRIIDNYFNKEYLENKILITSKNTYLYSNNVLKLIEYSSINNYNLSHIKPMLNLYISEYIIDKFIGNSFIYDYNKVENLIINNFLYKINIILFFNSKNCLNFEYNLNILFEENYKNYNIIIFFYNIEESIINEKKIFIKNFNDINKNNIFIFSYINNEINETNKINIIFIILFLIELSDNNSLILIFNNNFILDIQFSLENINNKFINNNLLDLYHLDKNTIISKKEYYLSNILNDSNKDDNLIDYLKNIFSDYNNLYIQENIENNSNIIFKKIISNYLIDKESNYSLKKINILFNNDKRYEYFTNIVFHNIINNSVQKIIKNNLIKNNENDKNNERINEIKFFNDNFRNILIDNYINNRITYNNNIFSKIYKTSALIQIIIFIYEGLDINKITNKLDYINKTLYDNSFYEKCQVNIIDFNKISNYNFIEKYKVNYFLYDNYNYLKIKYNKSFAYNIVLNEFNNYAYNYEYLLFDDFNSNFDYNINELLKNIDYYYLIFCKNNNLNKKILNSLLNLINKQNSLKEDESLLFNNSMIFFHKDILHNISNFDNELFYNEIFNINFPIFNEISFFIEKIKKFYNSENKWIKNLISNEVKNNIAKKGILYEYESLNNNFIYDFLNDVKNNSIDNKLINKYKESYNCNKILYELLHNLNDNNFSIFINFSKKRDLLKGSFISKNIKTFFINLDERTDRLNNCLDTINNIKLSNFERFSGIKPEREDLKKFLILSNNDNEVNNNFPKFINPEVVWKKNNIEYLRGIIGCKLSHLEILKNSLLYEEQYIMILEDDIVFENNTFIFLELALNNLKKIDWDILYLTANIINEEDAIRVDTNLLYIKKSLTTTAQIFKKDKIKKIINIIENSDKEIDNTYSDLLENKYCVYPMCGYQRESWSDINKQKMNYGQFHKKFEY